MTNEKIIAFNGEAMLLNWSESNTRGRTVTFLLSDDGEAHPFRDFTVKSGKKAGQRFAMVLVEIDEDETVKERTPSQIAFLLCQDEQFWHWCNERSFVEIDSEATARAFILEACGITSRSQLDSRPSARATWEATFYQPYSKYRATITGGL